MQLSNTTEILMLTVNIESELFTGCFYGEIRPGVLTWIAVTVIHL